MGIFKIEGGIQLKGEITPQGAKNEALQILCAVLLTPEKEQSIKNIIQKLTEIEQITFEQANADLYLEYLKNPNA